MCSCLPFISASCLTGILIQCTMTLAAVSLLANIYVVRLYENKNTTHMSAAMRYLIFQLTARLMCYRKTYVLNEIAPECMASNGDQASRQHNTRPSNLPSSPPEDSLTETGEDRQAAADILDRLFLFIFCIVFVIIFIYSCMLG